MGQGDILDVMTTKWVTSKEICSAIPHMNKQSIGYCLKKLNQARFIECKKNLTEKHGFLYRIKK